MEKIVIGEGVYRPPSSFFLLPLFFSNTKHISSHLISSKNNSLHMNIFLNINEHMNIHITKK